MADTYLSRTPSGSGNQKTMTFSFWIKRSHLDNEFYFLYSAGASSINRDGIRFYNNSLDLIIQRNDYDYYRLLTTAKFKDVSAWYHIVIAIDTTDSTSSNRFKMYVNGSQITDFQTETYPPQNLDLYFNANSVQYIGRFYSSNSSHFDGYMAETHFTDGTAYAPTTFGQTNTDGVWVPKIGPSVTYGTNGFYLKFENSGAMGTDSSGNSNTFSVGGGTVRQVDDSPTNNFATINSINASSIITISEGNLRTTAVGAWYSALGTIYATSGKWYFESVLTVDNWVMVGVAPTSQDINLSPGGGVGTKSMALVFSTDSSRGDISYNGANSVYTDGGHGINTGDIISVALDLDNNNVKFYKNNTQLYNLSNLLSDEPYTFGVSHYNGSALVSNFGQNGTFNGAKTAQGNADGNGKGDFYYAPPTGFLALCTDNLSSELTIPINKGADNFNPILYTGNGTSQTVTGVGFQPDFLWIKNRQQSDWHNLINSNVGATKRIASNNDLAENENSNNVSAFASDGFTVGSDHNTNANGENYISWNWKAGGTAPANTYAVKVVSDSGNKYRFDDYGTSAITLELQEGGTFTFDQSDASNSGHPIRFSTTADGTHGGGSEYTTGVTTNGTPGQSGAYTRITVAASAPTLYYYCSVHSGMGGQANTGSLFGFTNVKGSIQSVVSPNSTAGFSVVTFTGTGSNVSVGHGLNQAPEIFFAKSRVSAANWNTYTSVIDGSLDFLFLNSTQASGNASNSLPTSSVIYQNQTDSSVAYCFHSVEGYSKIGKYKGNGSTDGTFVYTGFTPAWVMYKNASSIADWLIYDTKRIHSGTQLDYLEPNTSDSEGFLAVDVLSNGFKLREASGAKFNASGDTYIYMAFAENPFVSSGGTPVTAR